MISNLITSFFLSSAMAETTKIIRICDNQVASVPISNKGTVLDFASEPEKVILGTKGTFFIEFVKNDLVLSPKSLPARSNLFVYVFGKRYVLDLKSDPQGATVVVVKDCTEPSSSKPKPNAK